MTATGENPMTVDTPLRLTFAPDGKEITVALDADRVSVWRRVPPDGHSG
jgi:hypothetical protein